jgi:hypothetical protein
MGCSGDGMFRPSADSSRTATQNFLNPVACYMDRRAEFSSEISALREQQIELLRRATFTVGRQKKKLNMKGAPLCLARNRRCVQSNPNTTKLEFVPT